ncbi:class I SAM-dependent methyltransferase [Rhizobium laguerreae]|nr:class I SAM-dependent methyltransferase [Rhizobium laguerreae]
MLDKLSSHHIADNDWYNAEMAKSLIDKIFFLDKVDDAGMFVDFGCANGILLSFIEKVFPGSNLVGYDINPEMIAEAKARDPDSQVIYTADWNEVKAIFREFKKTAPKGKDKIVGVGSSVGHEIESYSNEEEKAVAYARIWGTGEDAIEFDYVAWRDMMASRATSRPADPIAVARVQQVFEAKHPGFISQWEQRWGHLGENWSLVHFLMTYRYVANWEREYRENYLPVNYEDFMASVPKKYMPVYQDRFTLPFLRRRVQEDFGIALTDTTHLKVVFELRR